jgi:kynureninase
LARAVSLEEARALDAADPLASFRAEFELPEGVLYLDGNSLGPLQAATRRRVADTVSAQWGEGLIRSWNTHNWIDLPGTVGAKIARLIGVAPQTVVVTDSTSVNIFKLLAVALAKRPDRKVILSEAGNFPTDLYIAQGLAGLLDAGHSVKAVPGEGIAAALDESVAVLLLTEVNYRSGRRHDMKAITRAAHAAGVLVIWDLCHSAGAFPVDLTAAGADFAVGCGYKYLNGGPGAPSFVHVAPRHLDGLTQPLAGWLGHAAPFSFVDDYRPAPSIDAMRAGTPPVLSLAALDASLDIFERVDMAALRAKADRLFDIFVTNVEAGCPELTLATPRNPSERGTQAAFAFREGYAAMQALIARGVIGDFRGPDIMRFGFTPLYLSHEDVWRAAQVLVEVMATGAWDHPAYKVRAKVV